MFITEDEAKARLSNPRNIFSESFNPELEEEQEAEKDKEEEDRKSVV